MASDSSNSKSPNHARFRATALQHAQMIEDKKKLRNQITDLVIECFDLPSQPAHSPATASSNDTTLFKKSLNLFQPSDFDDLVLERNIDSRCGYALCPNPNHKAPHDGKQVWSKETGFFVDRAQYERWCSKLCRDRGAFVRVQLSTEPAWLREGKPLDVRLLDEITQKDDLSEAIRDLAAADADKEDLVAKLKDLSIERGDDGKTKTQEIEVIEKESDNERNGPPQLGSGDLIEGLPTRNTPRKPQ